MRAGVVQCSEEKALAPFRGLLVPIKGAYKERDFWQAHVGNGVMVLRWKKVGLG